MNERLFNEHRPYKIKQSTVTIDRLGLHPTSVIISMNNTHSSWLQSRQFLKSADNAIVYSSTPSLCPSILPKTILSIFGLMSFTDDPHILVKSEVWILLEK